jgi:hypothetical protein
VLLMDDHLQTFLAQAGAGLCPNPVFVLGSPRSGTTALPRALARHSRLWTSHESYVLHHLYGAGRADHAWRRDAEREQAPAWLKTEGVSREEFLGFLGAGVNALFTSRSGGLRWIDQTPLNTLMVDDLALMFPGAQFIHMLRDGRHVVHSMSNFLKKFEGRPAARQYVPQWATDFVEACRTWRRWVETASDFCDGHPGRAMTVINERLVADPEAGFADLFRFLGVTWEDGPLEAFTGERINTSFVDDPAAATRASAVPTWDDERRQIFVDEVGAVMVRLGLTQPDELESWRRGEPVSEDAPRPRAR